MALSAGNLPLCTHRYLMMVSYMGSKYLGSQRQAGREAPSNQNTVQETLEWSLETFLPKKRARITSCSRTDRGVHALMNCFTLPLMDFDMPTEWIKQMTNKNLIEEKHDINVNEVILVPADFHPRKQAVGREYIYRIAVFDEPKYSHLCVKHKPTNILHLLPVTELYRILPLTSFDCDKAQEVIDMFNGHHDFGSFCMKQENQIDTVRDINIEMTKLDPSGFELPHPYSLYQIHFKSRSFLPNQIRRMIGAIISYASYKRVNPNRIQFMLDHPDTRNWTGNMIIAEPWGLYLSRIIYGRSAFKGAIKTTMGKVEIPFEEIHLPATIGLSDEEPQVEDSSSDSDSDSEKETETETEKPEV